MGYTPRVMGVKESNAGFVALHTPMGILIVMFSFLMFIAMIMAGSFFFKAAQQKDREERERLKNLKEGEAK